MSSTSNTQCCVRPCSNKSVFHRNRLQSTYFHTFPNQHKHPARYASWLAFVRCHRKEFKSGRGFYVCSDHFTWDDYVDTRQYDFNTASGDSAQTVILILKPDAVPSIAPIPRQPPASSKAALERAQCKLDKDHDEYIASVQGSANEKLAKTATIGGKVDQWISHQPNNRGDNDSCTLASSVSINQTQAEDEHTSAEEHNNIITTDIADIKRPLQTHLIEEPHVTPLVKERLRPPLIGTPPYPPLIETPPPPLPLKDYKPTDLELSAYQLHMIAAGENNSHITTQIQSRIGSIYPKKEPIDEYYAYPPYYFL